MEEFKKKSHTETSDKEIIFSKAIKAGKRIYYLDVKKNRKDEMFLAITESKKIVMGEGEDSQVSFEKHKIFLYREDFDKFMDGLNEAISFIEAPLPASSEDAPAASDDSETAGLKPEEIKIDIDF
ncbi:MAG: PUR family DNA/RNA-binding protein [Bacteroidaceae bacterium]